MLTLMDLPGGRDGTGSGPARVLVCDDTAQIRVLLRLNLDLEGYLVEEAADGDEAVARLRSSGPAIDVITLDALMPKLDGWRTVAAIRADPRLASLIVVMVTASTQHTDYERAVKAGVDAFVAKPFEPEQLISLIGRLLQEREHRGAPARAGQSTADP